VAGEFDAQSMAGQAAQLAAQKQGNAIRIGPLVITQCGADAGTSGFGGVNEQKVVFQGEQHGYHRFSLKERTRSALPGA
jgi:UDP-3-O-[3-hydroxymyristoyl] glucosamine N-acyltransferase